jgi:transposase
MLLKSLESLTRSETRANRYLVQKCWRLGRRFCVRCGAPKLYRLVDKRYRCARCGYTFHDFTGRWIDALNLSSAQWLWVAKLVELEFSPGRIALEIGISYPTAFKAIHIIRCAIFSEFAQGQPENQRSALLAFLETCRLGSCDGMRLAFGIIEKNRHATINAVNSLTPQGLRAAGTAVTRRAAALYSDRLAEYDAVLFTGAWSGSLETTDAKKIYVDGADGFWKFLREFLALRHGVSRERLPLYLVECQLRYHHRDQPVFELLVKYVTSLVPNYLQDVSKNGAKKNVANLRRVSR